MLSKQKTMEALTKMYDMFPEAHGELKHRNPYELLIAVILSAQATDVSVNKATPALFEAFPTPEKLVILRLMTLSLRSKRLVFTAIKQKISKHVPNN